LLYPRAKITGPRFGFPAAANPRRETSFDGARLTWAIAALTASGLVRFPPLHRLPTSKSHKHGQQIIIVSCVVLFSFVRIQVTGFTHRTWPLPIFYRSFLISGDSHFSKERVPDRWAAASFEPTFIDNMTDLCE
jgi:hypothetical protein